MHKILSSPEILEEIFLYSSRHTNTVTARVCRIWFTHSIRLIWKTVELNDAMRLLSLFHTEKSVINDFEQPLLPQAWDRFFLYSKNVRCLKCFDINYSALKQMIFWRPSTDIFPALTTLDWNGLGGCIRYLPPFLTLTLQRLYISLDCIEGPAMADGLCKTIATRSPYLRLFRLYISSKSDHGALSRPLGELVSHLSRLTVAAISAHFMTLELFIILSRIPNLKGLIMLSANPNFIDIDFEKTLMKQKLIVNGTTKEFSPFHSLTDLFIFDNQTFTTSKVLEHGFQFHNLTHLVCSPHTKTSEEITSLMELVHSVCPILKIITIKRPSGSSTRLPWQAIQALLKCQRLRTLEVFGRTVDMGPKDILTVATNRSSWLSVNLPSTQPLSYQAVIFFAHNCPQICKLGLTLDDNVGLPALESVKTDVLFSSLHTLNVGESPITSSVKVGLFLSQICGNALKIHACDGKYSHSWRTVAEIVDNMNSTARVRMLNKELDVLRETVAELKSSKTRRRTDSPEFKIKVDVKNEKVEQAFVRRTLAFT